MAKAPPAPGTFGFKVVKLATRVNVLVYRASRGRLGNLGMDLVILHHRGAKSGKPRETPLNSLHDGDNVILIASYGGAPKSPAWFHNVLAHPDVEIERKGVRRPMRARLATPDERAEWWPRAVEAYSGFADYQEITDREIPVVICAPRSP